MINTPALLNNVIVTDYTCHQNDIEYHYKVLANYIKNPFRARTIFIRRKLTSPDVRF